MIRVTRSAIIDAPIETVWRLVRDFNSHDRWHPIVAQSRIENGEPADRVGCVRNFTLRDGNRIREQLLALSDEEHVSTYCILDATVPLSRYVATVHLKRVTDGERTFWHWESTFDAPRGREREMADMVGRGVYEAGFDGLRSHLRSTRRDETAPGLGQAGIPRAATSTQAVVATAFGGPEVLELRRIALSPPQAGEITIRQVAIGVNYIDVYVRRGLYRMIEPPAVIGMEGAGVVEQVGDGVTHLLPGDRVAYACPPPGAYAAARNLSAAQAVLLPQDIGFDTAAALMLKGMTAQYLLHRSTRIRRGDAVLVHAAAGGLGLLLCQWARALGAQVIGTVSSEDKARSARAAGCEDVIVTADYRFAQTVLDRTGGRGVEVIFDGLGRAAFDENLRALATCGHWVSYGQATGPIEPVSLDGLTAKSATLTRPVLFHYTAERASLNEIATLTFEALRDRILTIDIRHRYPLAAAAQAHRDLEARRTVGPIVLEP